MSARAITTDLWPIWESATGSRTIGYIVATDDLPALPYPRLGEVYRRPRGWAAWPIGRVFGEDPGPRSDLRFRTRRDAIAHLVGCAQKRARPLPRRCRRKAAG